MDIQLQLEKSICEIIKEDGYGVGFFTKINYKSNGIYCLMSNFKSITETMLNKDYIEIKINNKIPKRIYLNKKRWTNKDLDYICIEIPKDDIEILEIDYNYPDNGNKDEDYNNSKDIVVTSINKDKKIEILKEKLIYSEKCGKFYYTCNLCEGFSGGSIILYDRLEVIGITCGNGIKGKTFEGIYVSNIIKDINRCNLIEGIINIKNSLLYNSKEEIDCEIYTQFLSWSLSP